MAKKKEKGLTKTSKEKLMRGLKEQSKPRPRKKERPKKK